MFKDRNRPVPGYGVRRNPKGGAPEETKSNKKKHCEYGLACNQSRNSVLLPINKKNILIFFFGFFRNS